MLHLDHTSSNVCNECMQISYYVYFKIGNDNLILKFLFMPWSYARIGGSKTVNALTNATFYPF